MKEDVDCVMGQAPTYADCPMCGITLTQTMVLPLGNGMACPDPVVITCKPGDGLCPADDVDCVLTPSPVASDCTSACGTLTQAVITPPAGNGM